MTVSENLIIYPIQNSNLMNYDTKGISVINIVNIIYNYSNKIFPHQNE